MNAMAMPNPEDGTDSELQRFALPELVRGAAVGDRQAWEGLVERYARLIWSTTVDFKLTESDAADVAEATWLRLLQHIDRIDHPERVGSWLAATARNECLTRLAAQDKIVRAAQDELVKDALSRLPRRYQRLIRLLQDDWSASYREIHRRRRAAVSPRRLTNLAIFVAGRKRSALRDEWRDHLSGETRRGLAREDQFRAACGFLWAAVRYRFQDALDLAWQPLDAILKSRKLSNLLVFGPTAAAAMYILRHLGTLGALTSAESISAIGGGLYGLVRVGRWWRDVKPPEPKARRASEQ